MKKGYIIYGVITVALTGTTAMSLSRYAAMHREKTLLDEALRHSEKATQTMRGAIINFEHEYQDMRLALEEAELYNEQLTGQLQGVKRRNTIIEKELAQILTQLAATENKLARSRQAQAVLESENQQLRQSQRSSTRSTSLRREPEYIADERFDTPEELKARLKELKAQQRAAREALLQQQDRRDLAIGNAGYMTRHGMTTYRRRIEIRVLPADL